MKFRLVRRTRILVHVLLLILGVWSAQIVHADQTYQISLLGGRWDGHRIMVQVPAQPAGSRDLVLKAMTTWNQAQIWFLQSYGKQEAIRYELVESVNGSVQIELVDFTGVTAIREAKPAKDGTRFTNATMFLPLSFRGYPVRSDWFETIALHEFGHVLGLDHTDLTTDLMSTSLNAGTLPSTLDLSGVHTLALGSTPSLVTLNSSIPYQEVPTSSVPEFHMNVLFVLGVSILFCAGLRLGRRRANIACKPG